MSGERELLKREDVEALAGELRDLKEVMREVSGKLGRIEKRLRLFFPASFPNQPRKERSPDLRDTPPTITTQQALQIYNELLDMARTGREQQVEARVAGIGLPDLALLVRELGAQVGKKPSRTGLTKSLMGRLKESVMLSRHTSRPSSQSTPLGTNEAEERAGTVPEDSDKPEQ